MAMADRISICAGCLGAGAEALAATLRARVPAAEVALASCMNVCGQPATVSLRAEGKAAYLFAGVDVAGQIEEIVAMAGLYAAAPDGMIEDARPLGDLRLCLVGRIPA